MPDSELITHIQAQGFSMVELFLAGSEIYVSRDAGGFGANSTYSAFPESSPELKAALFSLLQRIAAPAFESIAEVQEIIALAQEWEAIYSELMACLNTYGTLSEINRVGDYYVVSDDYGFAQHKVECTSSSFITPEVIASVQTLLAPYTRPWEVIFVAPATSGGVFAMSVFAHSHVLHS